MAQDTAQSEAQTVATHWRTKISEGETWCLLDAKWWQMWCKFSGFKAPSGDIAKDLESLDISAGGGDRPGPIVNARLHEAGKDYDLKRGLTEGEDYVIVPEAAYDYLKQIYGGGPDFRRSVIALGLQRETRVDLYPVFLRLVPLGANGEPEEDKAVIRGFGSKETFQDVLAALKKKADLPETSDKMRLWIQKPAEAEEKKADDEKAPPAKFTILRAPLTEQLLEGFQFTTEPTVWVETKGADDKWVRSAVKQNYRDFEVGDIVDAKDTVGKWYESEIKEVNHEKKQVFVHYINWAPKWDRWIAMDSEEIAAQSTHTDGPYEPNAKSTYSSAYNDSYYSSYSSNEEGAPVCRGAVGLRNLGNTCFMNSTLQCLSNTPGLTNFFLNDTYVGQINRDNPLGWKGRVADEYGALLKELWSGKYRTVAPSKFKKVLGEFAPRFSGYQQQDSSELLSFLLDGLHEDLNQVKKKPATATVESKGRSDEVVAAEAWDTYLKRNQSVVVDTLQGQLKSRLTCPKCNKVSITFDPFMFLSVPLPQVEDKAIPFTFVYADASQPMTLMSVLVSKVGYMAEFKAAVAKLTGISVKRLVVTDVWSGKICRYFQDEELVSEIRRGDTIFVYEIPEYENGSQTVRLIQIIHYQIRKDNPSRYRGDSFGLPLLVTIPKGSDISVGAVREKVLAVATPFVKPDFQGTPFNVVQVDNTGRSCAICDWSKNCNGCELPQDSEAVFGTARFLALEWLEDASGYRVDKLTAATHESSNKKADTVAGDATIGLDQCLDAFTKEEVLGEQDPWYCSDCKEHQRAAKKFDLWRLPNIMIIHLKRFSYSRVWREKINTLVDFPLEGFDLSKWAVNPADANAVYDLYAISNHMGSMGGGHYTAYCRNLVDGKWYLHDDSSIRETSVQHIKSPSAYVLFYVRRGTFDQVTPTPAPATETAATETAAAAGNPTESPAA